MKSKDLLNQKKEPEIEPVPIQPAIPEKKPEITPVPETEQEEIKPEIEPGKERKTEPGKQVEPGKEDTKMY